MCCQRYWDMWMQRLDFLQCWCQDSYGQRTLLCQLCYCMHQPIWTNLSWEWVAKQTEFVVCEVSSIAMVEVGVVEDRSGWNLDVLGWVCWLVVLTVCHRCFGCVIDRVVYEWKTSMTLCEAAVNGHIDMIRWLGIKIHLVDGVKMLVIGLHTMVTCPCCSFFVPRVLLVYGVNMFVMG